MVACRQELLLTPNMRNLNSLFFISLFFISLFFRRLATLCLQRMYLSFVQWSIVIAATTAVVIATSVGATSGVRTATLIRAIRGIRVRTTAVVTASIRVIRGRSVLHPFSRHRN